MGTTQLLKHCNRSDSATLILLLGGLQIALPTPPDMENKEKPKKEAES